MEGLRRGLRPCSSSISASKSHLGVTVELSISSANLNIALVSQSRVADRGYPEMDQRAVLRHTNRLIHEISPYLLQHAHNPVNWYPFDQR